MSLSDKAHGLIAWIFRGAMNLLEYIFDIRLLDAPPRILELAVIFLIGYIAAMIIFGVPQSIIEAITKKKLNDEIEEKIVRILGICLGTISLLMYFQNK